MRSREELELPSKRLVGLVAAASAFSAAIAFFYPEGGVHAWSLGTSYSAFFLLAAALAIGPLNVIRSDPNPVHSPLRRDVGIAAGVMAIAHTIIGLQVHFGGSLSRYFLPPPVTQTSDRLFLATNWMGLFSVVVLAVLVAVSNNLALRSFGLRAWKFVQRGAYPAAILAVVHAIIFQLLEKRAALAIALIALVAAVVTVLQLKGWIKRRRAQ